MNKLDSIFDSYVNNNLFRDKTVLQANYTPETIPHRTEQIEVVAGILAPALRGERVSNLFIFGKTGSGKTLSVQHVGIKITDKIKKLGQEHLKFIYLNCKMKKIADTEYRIIAELINALGGKVPATGLPTGVVYSRFI